MSLSHLLNLEILFTGLPPDISGQFRSKSDLKNVIITRAASLEFLGHSQRNVVALSRAEDAEADIHVHSDHYHQVLPHQRRLAVSAVAIVSQIILGTNYSLDSYSIVNISNRSVRQGTLATCCIVLMKCGTTCCSTSTITLFILYY